MTPNEQPVLAKSADRMKSIQIITSQHFTGTATLKYYTPEIKTF